MKLKTILITGSLAVLLVSGCVKNKGTPAQRAESAKTLFDQTTRLYHEPLAAAQGAEKAKLEAQAIEGYQKLLKMYPDQQFWCAQALRNMAGVYATQTNLNQALKFYSAVEKKYPQQEWEVLQAWKASGDLLWDASRQQEARTYYQKIVQRYDSTNQVAVVKLVVKGAKKRLESNP